MFPNSSSWSSGHSKNGVNQILKEVFFFSFLSKADTDYISFEDRYNGKNCDFSIEKTGNT